MERNMKFALLLFFTILSSSCFGSYMPFPVPSPSGKTVESTGSGFALFSPNTQTYYLGTMLGVGGGWTTTSISYANPSVATTSNTLTQIQISGFSSVSADSTKLPAIQVNFPYVGCYEVSASLSVYNSVGSITAYARLFDNTNSVIINGGVVTDSSISSGGSGVTLTGIECVSSTGNATLIVQLATGNASDTAGINQLTGAPITWMIHGL